MIELNARVTGQGEPVILLHGLFGSLENLGGIARQLAAHYEVHSLDLRNHGRSPHTEQLNYDVMAEDVLRYMDLHDIQRPRVLGHSMGGKVGMTLALKAPQRIRQLVVADIAPVHYGAHHDGVFSGLAAIDLKTLTSRQQADECLQRHVPEMPVRQFLLKNLVKSGEGGFQWRLNLPTIIRHYDQILQGQHAEHPYTGPVLFIKGGLSDYIKPGYQEHTATLFPNAQLKIIPGTGHWLHADKPELFARLVLRFFNSEES